MKKTIILAGAALVALVACNKSEVVNTAANEGIGFNVVVTPSTKAITNPQLAATTLGTDNNLVRMYVSATSKDANGTVQKGDFFTGQHFSYIGTTWKPSALDAPTTETPIYWPVGGATLDFLALAWYKVGHAAADDNIVLNPSTFTWGDGGSPDQKANKVVVADVDLKSNGLDLMFASANNQKGVAGSDAAHKKNETALAFKHAGAVVEINAKANVADLVKIQAIYFATLKEEKATFATNDYYTVDLTGTFTVDNSYNTLQASWSQVEQPVAVIASCEPYALDASPMTLSTTKTQAGNDVILVPQAKTDFVIKYRLGTDDTDYYITAPVKKGSWIMGHKYIYNITISVSQIELAESVVAYVDETAEDINI